LNGQRGGEQVSSVPRPWPNHPAYSTGFEVLLFRPSMPRILHIPQLAGPMAILKQNTNFLDYVKFLPFHIFEAIYNQTLNAILNKLAILSVYYFQILQTRY
jgi:hypothetical protein